MKSKDKIPNKKYDAYVEHPRYGRAPHYTGLNVNPYDLNVQLHSNATNVHELQRRAVQVFGKKLDFMTPVEQIMPKTVARIPGTAIPADPSRQNRPTVPVTHYYDIKKVCRDCKEPFIFFAEEQRYWYETLQFTLDADCVRCPKCRKTERSLARTRATYERLAGMKERNWKDDLKMAGSAMTLVENGVFGNRIVQTIRRLLKTTPEIERAKGDHLDLVTRLKQLGKQS
ncbi:MAG: zinc-ribbon domain containing protein [Verrucomicrobiota bacterium]